MVVDKIKYELALANACMSRKDLYEKGIARGTLNNIYHGRDVLPKTVGIIATALGVKAEDIVKEPTNDN